MALLILIFFRSDAKKHFPLFLDIFRCFPYFAIIWCVFLRELKMVAEKIKN